MPKFDLTLDQLETYQPAVAEPPDFDEFWTRTLAETRRLPLSARFEPIAEPLLRHVTAYDVTFAGWAGQPVKGWLLTPTGGDATLPCLVQYVGYGGGRGAPWEHLAAPVAGFALLVMDTRGQGAGWSRGDTPDEAGSGSQHPGFMTRGIEQPGTYYYRRVFADAVRAVEAAAAAPRVDPTRIAVCGASQGGGIAIAAAALLPEQVAAVIADVPFLCHFRRAVDLVDTLPYVEITRYLRAHRDRGETVFRTLSYFDGVNFAKRVRSPALFSVGLMDPICPPSTVYAAYNRIVGPRRMCVYEFNEHEGGGPQQIAERLRFAAATLNARG